MPSVNPDILVWARETAGLEAEEAARKAGLGPAGGLAPGERILAMERGEATPTRTQLANLAKAYRRPLIAFYLQEPPRLGDRGHDFRTTPGAAPPEEQAWLDVIIRDVRARHALVRAALEEDEDVTPVRFIGGNSVQEGSETVAARLRDVLDFDRGEFRRRRTLTEAFEYVRETVEDAGVFALLIGDLGSHHTAVSVDTFRGYALADEIAPMIVVNDRDARGAWSFTLLHEFCHLMLGESGVSGGFGAMRIERFCNDVASAVLLDDAELGEIDTANRSDTAVASLISGFARARNLSRTLVAYRLLRAALIPESQWSALSRLFHEEWKAHREDERMRAREDEGGPSYYVVRRHRLGPALLETVNYLLRTGGVSVVKAAKILGVKPNNVRETLAAYGG